jgi:hypothetical protein
MRDYAKSVRQYERPRYITTREALGDPDARVWRAVVVLVCIVAGLVLMGVV